MGVPLFKSGVLQFRSGMPLIVTDPSECDCCTPAVECSCCLSVDMPAAVFVELSGVADGTCGNCTNWNDTVFELPVNGCQAVLENIAIGCGESAPFAAITVKIGCQNDPATDGVHSLLIDLAAFSTAQANTFGVDVRNCPSAIPRTYGAGTIFFGGAACDFSGASAVITV